MSVLSIVGGIIFALGAAVWIGNVSRLFPTVPLAGYVIMLIGGAIFRAGKNNAPPTNM